VTHLDYQLTTNIWLTSVTVMPTAQTPKDRTTAAVRKVMQEMETNAMVSYNDIVCLRKSRTAWNVFVWINICKVRRKFKISDHRINLTKTDDIWKDENEMEKVKVKL